MLRNHFFKLLLIGGLSLAANFSAKAQIVIERPREHVEVEVRPSRPSARHYWRDGEWEWRSGAYVWTPGVWVVPERGHVWRRGHWRQVRGGYRWVPGHWR